MTWRNKVDPLLRTYLESQIKETAKNKPAYSLSSNPPIAQLWVAIANLAKQNLDLSLRLKLLEGVLKEVLNKEKNILKEKEPIKKKSSKIEKSLRRF